jgi:cytidine deaminase
MSRENLLILAREMRARAHAPFSRFPVGAALRTADGRVFGGCNVESSSYGLSICAERTAIVKAVSEGAREVVEIAIVADTDIPCPPCGACRQMLYDLGPNARVTMSNLKGETREATIAELLPGAFTAEHLVRHT